MRIHAPALLLALLLAGPAAAEVFTACTPARSACGICPATQVGQSTVILTLALPGGDDVSAGRSSGTLALHALCALSGVDAQRCTPALADAALRQLIREQVRRYLREERLSTPEPAPSIHGGAAPPAPSRDPR